MDWQLWIPLAFGLAGAAIVVWAMITGRSGAETEHRLREAERQADALRARRDIEEDVDEDVDLAARARRVGLVRPDRE